MVRYQIETEINKPIDQVTRLFANRANLTKWQPGIVSSEQVESYPYPKYKLMMAFGKRKMAMTETILRNELPAHFEGTYEMKGVFNRVHNSFEAKGPDSTRWIVESEFRFKGLMSVIAFFMKGDFKKQSEVIMRNFKNFVESQKGEG
jgi:hypothetical protein